MIDRYLDKVHNMNVMDLLHELPNKSISCVYSDVDYGVGIAYSGIKYSKTFNRYISDYIDLASESLRVLKDDGSAFFINYPKNNAFLWAYYLENACYDVQEYVWVYNSNIGHSPNRFTTAHRSILHCRMSKESKYYKDNVAQPYMNPNDKRIKKKISEGSVGRSPYSWFYYDLVKNVTKDKNNVSHPCVIPEKLSSLLIQSVTKPGDVILILFAGSGSEINVCRKLGRHFISSELDKDYCDHIEKQFDTQLLTLI